MANLKEVKVPNIGDFDAVEIIEVSVKEGDDIQLEQALITLETDKAAMDVPSPYAGKVASLKVKTGDKVKEGDIILQLEMVGDVKQSNEEKQKSSKNDAKKAAQSPQSDANECELTSKSDTKQATQKTFELPDLGTDGEVVVLEWAISEGDSVEIEQTILTLESDKAAMDVPVSFSGVLQTKLVKQGAKVKSNQAVAEFKVQSSNGNDAFSKDASEKKTEKTSSSTMPTTSQMPASSRQIAAPAGDQKPVTTGTVHAGPGVRRLAHQLGVDLTQVKGTGHKGRISYTDVHQFVKSTLQSGKNQAGMGIEPMPQVDFSQWGEVEVKPLNRIKKLTAKNLHRNWVSIPHVTQFDEADISELEAFRNDNKASAKQMGFGLTPLSFIMKAIVSSLQAYPQFNSSLDANGMDLIYKKYFHVGVAVDTPNGLVVPVVRDVDQKGLFAIAKELAEFGQKARDGKLKREDMQGSCFSISSLGSIGGTSFTPIINAPDVAILGVSKAQMKPVYQNGTFVPKLMLPLSLSYDHRVIDGAEAARFCRHLCVQLEDIRKLLL